ncbi:MAG: TadE/TadG family type IV pilus assembly protein [Halofilum sp. (in: g-proteobacteria)]|nr:TadE/TadG family type IV pilus assembly protein [Halofilum sp. (in: g-proteobacteria)]
MTRQTVGRRLRATAFRQQGVSAMETIITLPILLLLISGVYEYIRLEQTRVTVKHAALMSAREGAVGRAAPDALHDGLARGIAPLYGAEARAHADDGAAPVCIIDGGTCPGGGTAGDALAEEARAIAASEIGQGLAEVVILNPTREHFDAMSVASGPHYDGEPYLPNSGLQRMAMNSATGQGTQSYQKTYEITEYRSEITVDQFVQWLRGNGNAAGVLWSHDVPILSEVEPGYEPGACVCRGPAGGTGGSSTDGSDGSCSGIATCAGAEGVAWNWHKVNDANGDEHETDVDELEQIARANWPSTSDPVDASVIVSAINAMENEVDKIVQTDEKCFAATILGSCWGISKSDTDGPRLYEQAWFDYLQAMENELDDLSAPYQKEVTETIEYQSHSQVARGDIQDANVLKVLVIYGYRPVVPLPWLDSLLGDIGIAEATDHVQQGATLHRNGDYTGGNFRLSAGCYTLNDLRGMGLSNDDLSSVSVIDGYEVTLYQHVNQGGWSYTVDEDTALTGTYDNNASGICVNRTEDAPDPGLVEKVNEGWAEEFGSAAAGTGFNLIRAAAHRIRQEDRIPIMATATVRMQSPTEHSEHMLSVNSGYFKESTGQPSNATNPLTQASGPDAFNNPDANQTTVTQGAYPRKECVLMDYALRNRTAEEVNDPDGEAHEVIHDGVEGMESLVELGLWPDDYAARRTLIQDMQTECSQYDMENTNYDYSGIAGYDDLDEDQKNRIDQGQLEPSAWYVPPAHGGAVYQDAGFGGWSVELEPGCHTPPAFQNDDLSAVTVAAGFEVTIFEHIDGSGFSETYTSDTSFIGDTYNDGVSRVCVSQSGGGG